jgi:hypothetical protein
MEENTMATTKKLDSTGLSQVWAKIVENFATKKITEEIQTQLGKMNENAQVNVLESVKVNGTELEITDKSVNVLVPTGTLADLDEVSIDNLSEALKNLINGKAAPATTLSGYGITDAYTKTETDSAISTAVDKAVSGVYKFKGSVAFSALPTEDIKDGDVYNVTDNFTTTPDFEEGEGISYPAGTNVAYVSADKKWDCLAGIFDFSDFVKKSELEDITSDEIDAICVISE